MSLISLVIVLIVVGILLYLANEFLPMDAKIKKILNIVVVVVVIIWLIVSVFNLGNVGDIRVPQVGG